MKFRIRAEEDLSVINSLDSAIFSADDFLSDLFGWWWVATHNKVPVAFAGIKLYNTDEGVMSYFHRVGVLPEFRRNGLHKKLIKRRLLESKKAGAVKVVTYTMYYNAVSNNNLIRFGFKQYHPDYAWVGTDSVIYWQKYLR